MTMIDSLGLEQAAQHRMDKDLLIEKLTDWLAVRKIAVALLLFCLSQSAVIASATAAA